MPFPIGGLLEASLYLQPFEIFGPNTCQRTHTNEPTDTTDCNTSWGR